MNAEQPADIEHYREPLERMLAAIDGGQHETFHQQLEDITRLRERSLFTEIGKLTRQLHDALNAFEVNQNIGTLAKNEMPDVRVRLSHVIDLTEKAAHQSLGLIENEMPECKNLRSRAQAVLEHTDDVSPQDAHGFAQFCASLAERWHDNLSQLLLAQDYQDLTGQVIRDVIALLERVETTLIELVRLSGKDLGVLNKRETPERIQDQSQVDDLLSSLGF